MIQDNEDERRRISMRTDITLDLAKRISKKAREKLIEITPDECIEVAHEACEKIRIEMLKRGYVIPRSDVAVLRLISATRMVSMFQQ